MVVDLTRRASIHSPTSQSFQNRVDIWDKRQLRSLRDRDETLGSIRLCQRVTGPADLTLVPLRVDTLGDRLIGDIAPKGSA